MKDCQMSCPGSDCRIDHCAQELLHETNYDTDQFTEYIEEKEPQLTEDQ